MKFFKPFFTCALLACAPALGTAANANIAAAEAAKEAASFNVLVFSKTSGFRHHDAIKVGIPFFKKQGELLNFKVDASEDAGVFNAESLRKYAAIVLLNTTGEFLAEKLAKGASPEEKEKAAATANARKEAFRKYVENGGTVVGLHAATDAFHNNKGKTLWPEYQKILGAAFQNHPSHQTCTIEIVDKADPTVKHLVAKGDTWVAFDEWYNFVLLKKDNHVILNVDDKTGKGHRKSIYEDGTVCADHPFAWTRSYGKGKIFYTSRGHYGSAFGEPDYAQHVIAGLFSVLGKSVPTVDPASLPPAPKKDKKKK
jgi:type 1 glutamine amidotransferase